MLVQCISQARTPLTQLDLKRLTPHLKGRPDSGKSGAKRHKEFLDECLRHAAEAVQNVAADALGVFAASYLVSLAPNVRNAIVRTYCLMLSVENREKMAASYTRGAARALGALPEALFEEVAWSMAQEALVVGIEGAPDAETRKICVASLRGSSVAARGLLAALGDFSVDERGDVGSWAREAACLRLPHLLLRCEWSEAEADEMVSRLLHILAGRMDRLRMAALAALRALLSSDRISSISHREQLRRLFRANLEFPDEQSLWETCCCTLPFAAYRHSVFVALCVTGGLRSSHEEARMVLLRYLSSKEAQQAVANALWEALPMLLEQYACTERVIPHLLASLDSLVRNGCFDEAASHHGVMHVERVRMACWKAFVRSTRVPNVCVGIDLMCALMRLKEPKSSFHLLLMHLLPHPYPRVRQHACLQLQLALSNFEEALCPDADTRERLVFLLIGGAGSQASVATQVNSLLNLGGSKQQTAEKSSIQDEESSDEC